MKPLSTLIFCASVGLASLALGCAEKNTGASPGTASGSSSPSAVSPSSTGTVSESTGHDRVSSGTQGDTLEACLARIPSDASESQRMLATLSCERDARARASIDAVPGN